VKMSSVAIILAGLGHVLGDNGGLNGAWFCGEYGQRFG